MGNLERTQKSHLGDSAGLRNRFGTREPSSDPEESPVPTPPSPLRSPLPAHPQQPLLSGWLQRRRPMPRPYPATPAAANLARDSTDADQSGFKWQWAWEGAFTQLPQGTEPAWGGGCCSGQAPHRHPSGIYRHRTDTNPPVQTSPAALETSCFSASRTTQGPK